MSKLEIKGATLGYNKQIILNDISLEIKTGQIICIIGRNGVGKTTLFKTILGIHPLIRGKVLIDGEDIKKWSKTKYAQKVAYVPQIHSVPFPFTVFDIILFGRTAHLSRFASPGRKDRIVVEECMEKLKISSLRNRIFTQLSGGEQQMVIVARALAQQPSFLIMDEPTSNLDFGNQIKLIKKICELKDESLGILMATHSPDQAFVCNADVAVVHQGGIWKQGHCNDIITQEVLKEIYQVNISVCSLSDQNGNLHKVCMPENIFKRS